MSRRKQLPASKQAPSKVKASADKQGKRPTARKDAGKHSQLNVAGTDGRLPSKTETGRQLPAKTKKRKSRRRAGGLLFSMILILGSLGTAFCFGWIQFRIEEGEYAVVYTKSHGYEKDPIPYGKFAWRWQALLPTNLNIHRFKINTRTLKINQSGSLPSADYYTGIVGGNVDFTWKVQAHLVYRINPQLLPSMVEKNGPNLELESYYDNFESRVNSAINNVITRLIDSPSVSSGFSNPMNTFSESLLSNIREGENNKAAPAIIISELAINGLSLPDLPLYTRARETAETILKKRKETLLELQTFSLQEKAATDSRLEILGKYGDIITKYPALIDLFALEGNPAASLLPPTGEP